MQMNGLTSTKDKEVIKKQASPREQKTGSSRELGLPTS